MTQHSSNTKIYSDKQEKLVSDALGWKQVSGSGSRPLHPGDVVGDRWIGECKTHVEPNKPLVFSFSVWNKIKDEAISRFKQPILFVDDGSQTMKNTWCLFQPKLSSQFTTQIKLEPKQQSFRTTIKYLEQLYADSPYIFLVIERNDVRYALMPLSEFVDSVHRFE